VNSQLPKVSNKLKTNPTSDHVFKLLSSLMKSNHKFLGQPKFDNMNMQIFFFKNKTSVCKCVSHTPKRESYIVPNVCTELKNEVKGIGVLE
jgi:hypothetical protein